MHELLEGLEGKSIFVKLKSNSHFTGQVTKIIENSDGDHQIHIIDKFGKIVVFLSSEIVELKEK